MSRMAAVEAANLSDMDFGTSGPMGTEPALAEEPQVQAESHEPQPEVQEGVETEATPETQEVASPKVQEKAESEIKKLNNQMASIRRQQQALNKRGQEFAALQQQLEARESKVAALENLKEMNSADFVTKYAEAKGVPVVQVIRELIQLAAGVQEAPEPPKEPELDPRIKAEFEKGQKELQELKQQMLQKEQSEKEAQEEALIETYAENGLEMINDEAYPLLAAESETDMEWVKNNYLEIADRYAERTNGDIPEPQEVLEYMENILAARAERLSAALQKKTGRDKKSKDSKESAPETGAGSPTSSSNVEAPRALTNRSATERSTPTDGPRRTDRDRTRAAAQWLAQQRHKSA